MLDILAKPGYLNSFADRGQRLRTLYQQQSQTWNANCLNEFARLCYIGAFPEVKQQVESGIAPDLTGSETPFKFGYGSLVVFGAQRLRASPDVKPHLKHFETLRYLLSCGLPPDVPDIVGSTALHHATMKEPSHIPLARLLLQNGADPNYQDRYGCVPLLNCFQTNQVEAIDLLLEFGADLDIGDGDNVSPSKAFLGFGPQVTAVVRKWVRKRAGEEAPLDEKKCDNCGKLGSGTVKLKMCSSCHTARYCSTDCQKKHWRTHKPVCRPFSESNTITLKPTYEEVGTLMPTAHLTRQVMGHDSNPIPERNHRTSNIPSSSSSQPKPMIIKVQVPYDGPNVPLSVRATWTGPLLIYNKKRDFVCTVAREDGVSSYDRISALVRAKGVGGAKGYFAAELKNKNELVVKVDLILAEQPF
ncbi:hypothetical protein JAAARDRAFT_141723 [Jaapia argillacea MUCL 33604]|uniref:MYND-type domain-containing protein n=1 Tax=Jaapia argillacea MUCL 33604 TaxID=933084 RepID=A0A067PJE1_9AGAM|nr:hypothetical protein JAAARDRAFT_141723 [Jaapia argillacea MUCL 33604]